MLDINQIIQKKVDKNVSFNSWHNILEWPPHKIEPEITRNKFQVEMKIPSIAYICCCCCTHAVLGKFANGFQSQGWFLNLDYVT